MSSFGSRRAVAIAMAVALSLASACVSAQTVKQYMYQPDQIYTVRAGLGITTQIEISPNEEVLDYSVGFSNGWDVSRRDNIFYLRPKDVDVDTNMMVRTQTNAYIFELRVVATDWRSLEQVRNSGVNYKVTFEYPPDTAFAETRRAELPTEMSVEIVPGRAYHFNYDYATRSRASWLVPLSVHDDGRFTYIRLNDMRGIPTGNFPAVYGRETERSEEFLLNTTVENNVIVVHGIYPYLVIRQGSNVIGLRRGPAQ